jgi:hypothetical protein
MATRDHTERGNFRPGNGASPQDAKPSKSSSLSDDSGTLNGDDSPTAARGNFNATTSPNTSNADTLTSIIESPFFKNSDHHFEDNPNPRNGAEQRSSNTPTEPARYRVIRNTSTPFSGGGVGGGFRNSRTWVSPDTRYMHEFTIIRNAMRRLFKHSDVAKWRYVDYITHREAMIASQKNILSKSVYQKELELELRIPQIDPKAFATLDALLGTHNLTMEGNTSRVLGEKTIWCVDWMNGKDEIAPWPSMSEMKWEGDDRAKTGVGRFPAIPREVGAPGIAWNQLQAVEVYSLDQVWRIPQLDDILLPVDEIVEDDKPGLITSDLDAAMNEYLES